MTDVSSLHNIDSDVTSKGATLIRRKIFKVRDYERAVNLQISPDCLDKIIRDQVIFGSAPKKFEPSGHLNPRLRGGSDFPEN